MITTTFEFDVPSRFDTDKLNITLVNTVVSSFEQIPVVELLLTPNVVFDEVRMPVKITEGATGGPNFNTVIVSRGSGKEQRIGLWSGGRLAWDVSHALRNVDQKEELIAFFRARKGKRRGFRFKDWSDYRVVEEEPIDLEDGTYQLVRRYTSGPVIIDREITKPVGGTFHLFDDAVEVDPGDFSLDYETGILTYPLG